HYITCFRLMFLFFFFSSRRRHTRCYRDWSSDVCSSDLVVHLSTAVNALGFVPWLGSYILLDKLEFGYLAAYFIAAGMVFYRNYREAPSGVLRQQLKWLTGGTLLGALPVSLLYILPRVVDLSD